MGRFGLREGLVVAGLGMMAAGLAMVDVALALIVTGALLFALAVVPMLLMGGGDREET